jgi:hypothetical protein
MSKFTKTTFALALLAALPFAQAANLSKADYDAGKMRIEADYKANKAACASLAGNAKDICQEEAQGTEKVAKAELEYGYTGKPADWTKVLTTKADAGYEVAKEKCDDLAGNAKDVCVKEAKAVQTKALADAKLGKKIGDAEAAASEDKRKADYKVATEKCESLSGDAKSSCMASAKASFGKS